MNTHTVRANDGYESYPMSLERAQAYAKELRRLGNYRVIVMVNK